MSAVASGVAEQYHHRLGLLEHRFWVHWQHRHLYRQEEGIFIAWGRTILTASLFCRRATTRLLVRVGHLTTRGIRAGATGGDMAVLPIPQGFEARFFQG